ncbi:DUF4238 domain-containing protein [Thalassospira sp.]|uniref:DUF4238 domain-containing protein n=1 Tax=Thalassospira sp. TaxID=1912094 RepID=UPI0032EC6C18
MAAFKNQHYVPKCYLRRFSSNGKSISLCNISSNRFIDNAAISKQCSKGYFYGEDLVIEKSLGILEEGYSKCIGALERGQDDEFENNIHIIRMFCLVQYYRTKVALTRSIEYLKKMGDLFGKEDIISNVSGMSEKDIIGSSIVNAFKVRSFISDLDFVVVRNNCSEDFISSDDPCLLINKFYSQKFPKVSFGLSSSGLIFVLPVTPRFCIIFYDSGVHWIEGKRGNFVDINRYQDLVALNLLQCLKAESNIYFRDKANIGDVAAWFSKVSKHRVESWCNVNIGVEDPEKPGVFKVLREGEIANGTKFLYHVEDVRAQPVEWMSFLKYRLKPDTYSDGSAMGHVRPATRDRLY